MKPRGNYLFLIVILLAIFISVPAYGMTPAWNITNNGEYISTIAIAPDGSRVITGTLTGIATVYDKTGKIFWETQLPGSLVVGFQENGSSFIIGSQENMYSNKGSVRSYASNGSLDWKANTGYVAALSIAAKNNRIVVGNRMGDLIVLDGQGKEVARFNDSPQTDVVSAISVSDDGNVFTYSLYEKYPKLRYITIDTRKKTNCEEIFNPSGSVSKSGYGGGEQIKSIAISSDGKYVISSYGEGSHGTLCLFPYFGWKKLWKKESGEIRDIAISTNGSSVYAGLGNGDIVGYSQSGNLSFNYSSGSPITSLSVASDKNLLAAGNADGNLYLFDHTGDLLWTTNIEEFPVGEITQVEISRNGASLVALVNNKHLYFYTQEPGTSQDESLKFTGTFTPVSTNTPVSTFTPVSESTPGKIGISTALLVLSLLAAIVLVRRK